MKKHLLVAMTNPVAGRDKEYNEWYDTVAIPAFARRPRYQFSSDIDTSRFFEPIFVALGDVNFAPLDRFDELKD
jgi:hypothetical protein